MIDLRTFTFLLIINIFQSSKANLDMSSRLRPNLKAPDAERMYISNFYFHLPRFRRLAWSITLE